MWTGREAFYLFGCCANAMEWLAQQKLCLLLGILALNKGLLAYRAQEKPEPPHLMS